MYWFNPVLRELLERPFFENVKAGVPLILKIAALRMCPSMKSRDPRVRIDLDEIRVQRMVVRMEQQGSIGVAAPVRLPDPVQIHVHHGVSIEDNETVRQQVKPGQDCARRPQRLWLDNVTDLCPPTPAVTQVRLDQVRPITNEDKYVRKPVVTGEFHLVFEERLAADGNHRLGQVAEAIFEARPPAPG